MKRSLLAALLLLGVVCAAVGVALAGNPFSTPSFGWTAYSPLADATYRPYDPAWLTWAPRIGLALVALGAGTSGASLAVLVLQRTGRNR